MKITRIDLRRRERFGNSRIYFHHEGERIQENVVNRRDRPSRLYRQVLWAVIAAANAQLRQRGAFQITAEKRKAIYWSRTAGCSCGCSPGFVIQGHQGAFDIHVGITQCAPTDATLEAREQAVEKLKLELKPLAVVRRAAEDRAVQAEKAALAAVRIGDVPEEVGRELRDADWALKVADDAVTLKLAEYPDEVSGQIRMCDLSGYED